MTVSPPLPDNSVVDPSAAHLSQIAGIDVDTDLLSEVTHATNRVVLASHPLYRVERVSIQSNTFIQRILLGFYQRELEICLWLATHVPGLIPKILAYASNGHSTTLILEDLGNSLLSSHMENLNAAATGLQQLHALDSSSYSRSFPVSFKAMAETYNSLVLDGFYENDEEYLSLLNDCCQLVSTRMAESPVTVIHTDPHIENWAICSGRNVLFDWSRTTLGYPLVDIVRLLTFPSIESEPVLASSAVRNILEKCPTNIYGVVTASTLQAAASSMVLAAIAFENHAAMSRLVSVASEERQIARTKQLNSLIRLAWNLVTDTLIHPVTAVFTADND